MKFPLCVALAAALAAPIAMAEPLSFDAAVKQALATAPSLQARSAEVKSTQSAARAAGRLPDPKLRVGFDNFPVSGPVAGSFTQESMTMGSIALMQEVPNGDKRRSARLKAAANTDVASANQNIDARDVRLNTALAWVDLYFAEKKLAALDGSATVINTIRSSAASQLASGTLRPAQALEGEQLMAMVDDRRADLAADVARARAELVHWTGNETADVSGEPPDWIVNPGALRANLDHNPQLAAAAAMTHSADADVAVARADKRPDWGWDVAYQHRDPRWGDMVSGGVTISLPLFSKSRQDPTIDSKSEAATAARLQADAIRRQVVAQLDADLADHDMHHDRMNRAELTLVPLAEKTFDLEESSYAAGNASLTDVLKAQLNLAEADIDLLSRQADVVRDGIRINLTYGNVTQ